METFDLDINGMQFNNCTIVGEHYQNNKNNALIIYDENKELLTVASVNTDVILTDDEVAIKDYSENTGMAEALKAIGIIDEVVDTIKSGFVDIPVYTLTTKGKELFNKENK